jgi:hypothetical protein
LARFDVEPELGARALLSPDAYLPLLKFLTQPRLRTALLQEVGQNAAGRPGTASLRVGLRRDCLSSRWLRFGVSMTGRQPATLGASGRLSEAGEISEQQLVCLPVSLAEEAARWCDRERHPFVVSLHFNCKRRHCSMTHAVLSSSRD